MQYIWPSFQFVPGLFVYGEPFDVGKLVGFAIVWAALVIDAIDGLSRSRTVRQRGRPGDCASGAWDGILIGKE